MTSTPYQSVAFNPGETGSVGKFNQLATNSQYLFENLAKVRYSSSGLIRDTSMKILAMRIPFSATSARQIRQDVYFDGFFTSGCAPICVGSGISTKNKRLQVTFAGLGNASLAPDARGAFVQIEADEIYPVGTDQLGGMMYAPGFIDCIFVGY